MILDPFITLTAQWFTAMLLLAGAAHKGRDLSRTAAAIAAYRLLPPGLEMPMTWLLTTLEAGVGVALLFPETRQPSAWLAGGIFVCYFAIMAISLIRGHRNLSCGCSLHTHPTPLSAALLVRNLLLAALAAGAASPEFPRRLGLLDDIQIAAAVMCLAFIYLSADSLLANRLLPVGQEHRQ